jgi:polysaccharide pyruvyl transferase WcaK-like protein
MDRRAFLAGAAAVVASLSTSRRTRAADSPRGPRILLRSSWQVVNIGDIAHTPGVLPLIEKHLPDADVVLWASGELSEPVAAMERKRFPKLKIVKGALDPATGKASNDALADAVKWADFFLHGSGPSVVGYKDLAAFAKTTQKPFGIYGVTYDGAGKMNKDLLSQARFFYFRDSVSLARAKADGVKSPVMEFSPDGAFACDVRDDDAAAAFLKTHGLEERQFLCCIPRLRYTPYWTIRANREMDDKKHARNEAMKDHDHAPLRDAIAQVVRQTPMKVLLCPEDMTQLAVGKENVFDKLPDDVRAKVVWRENFWLTDEALSTYLKSAGLFGLEMHSPIMCIGHGVPAIVGRFAEQTSKGMMWRDIGLGDWLFDFDVDAERNAYAAAVLAMASDPAAARTKAAKAREFVTQRFAEMMAVVKAEAKRARG